MNLDRLAQVVCYSREHTLRLADRCGLHITLKRRNETFVARVCAVLESAPVRFDRWTYREAAERLGMSTSGLALYCERHGIEFPSGKVTRVKKQDILKCLSQGPRLKPFWTYCELGRQIGRTSAGAKRMCDEWRISLPQTPLVERMELVLQTLPADGTRWNYEKLTAMFRIRRSDARCLWHTYGLRF